MATVKIEMTIPRELKDEPLIYRMCTEYRVIPRIIEASFSSQHGWAYLSLEGVGEEIDRLLDYLREIGITVDKRD